MSDVPAYTWADAAQTAILVSDADGVITSIPAIEGSRRYAALLRD